MARKRVIPNLMYGTLGLAVVGTGAYFAFRALRNRREGEDTMMALRRSSREAGRAIKDTATKIGKEAKRGAADTSDAIVKAGREFEASPTTSYNRV